MDGKTSDDLGWIDPLNDQGQSLIAKEGERFNNPTILYTAQKRFWDAVIVGVLRAKLKQYRHLLKDGHCNFLMELLFWMTKQDKPKQIEIIRRLNNNFGSFGGNELEIRAVQSIFYRLYLSQHPEHRELLVKLLFEVNPLLVRRVEAETRPSGLKKIPYLISGKPTALLGYDAETGRTQLQLEGKTARERLLLTGPERYIVKEEVKKEEPKYPGHIFSEEAIAANIDHLVKTEFVIDEPIKTADEQGKVPEALGQLFTAIGSMLQKKLSAVQSTSWQISRVLKPFRTPERLPNKQANIFGNVLAACASDNAYLRIVITNGIKALCRANTDLFEDIAWEFFSLRQTDCLLGGAGDTKTAAPQPLVKRRPVSDTPERAVAPSATENLDQLLAGLGPIERLSTLYLSNQVNFRKLQVYDPYVREILCLILAGQQKPSLEALDAGYKEWQKLVHPDKMPDETTAQFSQLISGIGDLVKKREFIREEGERAIKELFEIVAKLLSTHALIIVPQRGQRHIVLNEITVGELIRQKRYTPRAIKVILMGLIVHPDQYADTKLRAGDTIEIVTFD